MKGITDGKDIICVTQLCGLKKPCLCSITDGNVITKFASFDSPELADQFVELLYQMTVKGHIL